MSKGKALKIGAMTWAIRHIRQLGFRGLIGIAIGLIATAIIAIALTIWQLRSDAIRDADRDTGNIATVLSEQLSRSIQSVDFVLTDVSERLQRRDTAGAEPFQQSMRDAGAYQLLSERLARLSQVDFIALVDKDGQLAVTTRAWPAPKTDLADRDYFLHFKDSKDTGIFISTLLVNRLSGNSTLFFSKRIVGPNNSFLGVVLTGIRLSYFEAIYNSISQLRQQSFLLARRDGTVLIRHPDTTDRSNFKMPANSPWYAAVAAGGGHYRSPGYFDGHARFVAVQPVHEYPLVIDVAVSEDAALERWARRATQIGIGASLALVCFAILLKLLSGQFHRLARSEASLAEREAKLAENSVQLKRANTTMDAALHNMVQGLCMFDRDGVLIVCNSRYLRMYNLSTDVVRPGCSLLSLLEHRRERGNFSADPFEYSIQLGAAARNGEKLKVVAELDDGRVVEIVNEPMIDGGWVATHEEVTERVRAERERIRAEQFLHAVVENMPATVFVKDAKSGRYVLLNRAGEDLFGLSRREVIGKQSHEAFSREQVEAIESLDDCTSGGQFAVKELSFRRSEQDIRLLHMQRSEIRENGEPRYILGVVEDVTERKKAEARIAHLAHHDVLTGLPNRAAFNDQFSRTLEQAKKNGSSFAILCLDLDRFKYVNDLFGHATGDALLREVANRLNSVARGTFLARIGGDEFTFIASDGQLPGAAARLAERVVTALGDMIEIEGHKLNANASVGISVYPNDATDGEKLISNADAALYRAKAEGSGSYRFFEQEMDRVLRENREIQHELKTALTNGEFHLVYQPEATIDGIIIGFEALARWEHPLRGLIAPNTFIPLAEDSGLIIALGEWVLRSACREAASWPSDAVVGVNLSAVQFRQGDLPNLVHLILLETGLPPSRLELEITESILIDDYGHAQSILRRLKSLGVKIVMDDFGTGYSSLSYLQSFPFDKIKIDQSFVANLETNNNDAAIVRAVITLAKSLNLPVLAEGVETEKQRLILRSEGCDQIQGYLIGRPESIDAHSPLLSPRTSAAQKEKLQVVKLGTARPTRKR